MAVTANQLVKKAAGDRAEYPAAIANLYEGSLAFLNVSGYLDDDTGTGANRFAGILVKQCDNSGGAAGDLKAEVYSRGVFELTGSGFAQTSVGLPVYATDNYTITLVAGGSGVPIGRIVKYISSTKVLVEIDTRVPKTPGGPITVTASTLTVTKAEHEGRIVNLSRAAGQAVTLPAATGSGDRYLFHVLTTITSNTSTIKVVGDDTMVGGAVIFQDGGGTVVGFEAGGTDDTVTFNGSTTGGIKGDLVELIDIGADLWYVNVLMSGTGSEATPFSATV